MAGLGETIEELIDEHGISVVLRYAGLVCEEKAAHVRVSWQDESLSKRWDKAAAKLDKLAAETMGM